MQNREKSNRRVITSGIGLSRTDMCFRQRIRNLSLPYSTAGDLEQSRTTTITATDRPKHTISTEHRPTTMHQEAVPEAGPELRSRPWKSSPSPTSAHRKHPVLKQNHENGTVGRHLKQTGSDPLLPLVEFSEELVWHMHHDPNIYVFAYNNQANHEILSAARHNRRHKPDYEAI